MDLFVTGDGSARFGHNHVRCSIGRGGVSADKVEGDGTTPLGEFPCRMLYWRADRVLKPDCRLPRTPLSRADGWCDDPADPAYNTHVRLPYPARAEALWRDDRLYDVIVTLGYNDNPIVPGKGSAIFLHVAAHGYSPTEGCIGLAQDVLVRFVASLRPSSKVVIRR